MKKYILNKKLPIVGIIGVSELIVLGSSILAVYLTFGFYNHRILPNTTINNISVGGLTIEESIPRLQAKEEALPEKDIVLSVDDIVVASGSGELGIKYNYDEVVKNAYLKGKSGSIPGRFFAIIKSVFVKNEYQTQPILDNNKSVDFVTWLKLKADINGEHPSAELGYSGSPSSLTIDAGSPGRIVELEPTIAIIQEKIKNGQYQIGAKVASTSAQLTQAQIEEAKTRATALVGTSLVLADPDDASIEINIDDVELIEMLNLPLGYNELVLNEYVQIIAEDINRPAQNAEFSYNSETLEVEKFVPDKPGVEIASEETAQLIREALKELEQKAAGSGEDNGDEDPIQISRQLVLRKTQPDKSLAETNNLGIKERIGYGDSEYAHSIPNRVHNVKITTDRVSNTIVLPGEEFSFNNALGEVSARTGYRTAYVIKGGRTELGDGGGVCQVSTTFFRAVLNAGLKVTKRIPHSYRVSYYELDTKPGIDATVYSGNIDFKFVNDTNDHILIHASADSDNLTMFVEIYGTSDGRTTEISDHETWGYQPPPPSEYYPDATIPAGTTRQIDWAAAGIKAKFTNTIRAADGEIISQETYTSNYRPWSAKYLVGQ